MLSGTTAEEKKTKKKGKKKKEVQALHYFFCLAHEKEAASEFPKEQNLKFILKHKLI